MFVSIVVLRHKLLSKHFWKLFKIEINAIQGFGPRIKPGQLFIVYYPYHFFDFCFKQIIYLITEECFVLNF